VGAPDLPVLSVLPSREQAAEVDLPVSSALVCCARLDEDIFSAVLVLVAGKNSARQMSPAGECWVGFRARRRTFEGRLQARPEAAFLFV
jgi:hypothetical protein